MDNSTENFIPDDVIDWITLSLIPGVGGETFRQLLKSFGLPNYILNASYAQLSAVVKSSVARAICDRAANEDIDRTLSWLKIPGNNLVTLADTTYPVRLLEIADPPPLLYVKGRIDLLNANSLAIIGSRNATPQGISNAESFAQSLSEAGLTITSGLALGIDAAAHKGGLTSGGSSVAVIGTGLDIIYPAKNKELAFRLAREGVIVSEFPLGTPAIASNFPRRNRIISGLSRGCLIVEATLKSGSLITARLAAEQGREVFAIPGSIHSPFSKGCHALIKQGAKLIESANDILEELHWHAPVLNLKNSPLEDRDDPLLIAMGYEPVAIDGLATRMNLPVAEISSKLLTLEIEGKVSSLPGGLFQRLL